MSSGDREYCQIECYVEVVEGVVPLLERFREVLEQLSGDFEQAGTLVAGFPMDTPLSELAYPKRRPVLRLRGPGATPAFEPCIMGWRKTGKGPLARPRIEFVLMFAEDDVAEDGIYTVEAGAAIWRMIDALHRAFEDSNIFLTNEENEGHAYNALVSGVGHVFDFDLACFPDHGDLDGHHPPFDYDVQRLPGCECAIHLARWTRPPWP